MLVFFFSFNLSKRNLKIIDEDDWYQVLMDQLCLFFLIIENRFSNAGYQRNMTINNADISE